jgi:hypothetical protein
VGEHLNIESKCQEWGAASNNDSSQKLHIPQALQIVQDSDV